MKNGNPGKNATADEIDQFVVGNYLNNRKGDKLKKVPVETLKEWKKTLEREMQRGVRGKYDDTLSTIVNLISQKEGGSKTEQDVDAAGKDAAEEYTSDEDNEIGYYRTRYRTNDNGEDREDTQYVGIFTSDGKEFFNLSTPNGESNTTLINMTSTVLGIIQVVGSVLSVLILVILGIKYMAGSVEEKADYKKELPIYVLGAIILFSISNLLSVIYNWAIGLNNIS